MPILEKTKSAYLAWFDYYQLLPKVHKRSLGQRIDNLFVEIIEAVSTASFLERGKKLPYVVFAIKKTDVLKILLMILWETKSLDNKKYIAMSQRIDEVGKMLGGWNGQIVRQLEKENSPQRKEGGEVKRVARDGRGIVGVEIVVQIVVVQVAGAIVADIQAMNVQIAVRVAII